MSVSNGQGSGPLSGRVAIVTGAGSGIGRATVLAMARQGASVVVADFNETAGAATVDAVRQTGGDATFARTDVRKEADAAAVVQHAMDAYGSVNILVNNAGVVAVGKLTDLEEEEWDRLIDTNLKGYFLMAKHALPHLVAAGGGVIVNVASDAGLVGFANLVAYCASKGGVVQFTRALAVEYGPSMVRVNAVAPTSTLHTGMVDSLFDSVADSQRLHDALAKSHPLPRLGTADEIADAIVFLAGDSASYITGAILPVDGGMTAASPVAEF